MAKKPKEHVAELAIGAIGHRGDGIAATEAGPVYVPFTLPGERIRARIGGTRGTLLELVEASPRRATPVCAHFGACGGCLLQHMPHDDYLEMKRGAVAGALAARGLDVAVDPVVEVPVASRRRAAFSAVRLAGGRLAFGFAGYRSHAVTDIAACPILAPELAMRLDALRALAGIAAPARGVVKLNVLASETGLDVLVVDGKEDAATRQLLLEAALRHQIARISYPSDTIVETVPPRIGIAGSDVTPPPGSFLQAARESEEAIAGLAVEAVRQARGRHVADLFCGLGAFALRIAPIARVEAVDSDAAALAALDRAVRHAQGLKPVAVTRRDLFRNPLTVGELDRFEAIVFDPPRAGAERQAAEIARCRAATVVAVSCNPATLARDLALLVAGGYRLRAVTPVDQFVFSPHIEVVAVCQRGSQ